MLRDFKFLRRYSGKSSNSEEAENVPVNPSDSVNLPISTDPSRPPLNAIQEPSRIPKAIPDQEINSFKAKKVDNTPVKPKRKYSDTSMSLRTPEKQGVSKNRFSWGQKSEYSATNGVVELKDEGRVVSTSNTPTNSTRMGSRANPSYSECNSTQSTPTKSVSKPPNPGLFSASGSRAMLSSGPRTTNYSALSKGAPCCVVNTVEVPYFELKEDPSFWMEHNVQVLIRIRPLNNLEKSTFGYSRCLKQESPQCVTWIGHPETRFMFDHVACEAIDQETLFRMVGLPMVENCLSGYNSCMFAYGQTGSGKTHTMLGEIEELEVKPSPNRGMTPRIFEFLFARIRAEEESRRDEQLKYNCKCSFLEIYNEQITDLLNPSSTNLMLREDTEKGVYVEDLSEFEVHSVGDILQLLTQGSASRKVAATNMNRESSRSHCVFTCVIESRWEKDSTTNFRFARLNLVDLAGSERQKTSGAEGERLKEAANINKSLSALGHVIMVLVDIAHGKARHVPYRDSKLTFLLQDSLGGNSKTVIIANVSPSICSAAETLNTLKFAQRGKLIQNNAVINEDSSGDVIALKHQIQLLKDELFAIKREKEEKREAVSRSLSFEPPINSEARNKCDDDCNERIVAKEHPVDMLGKESNGVLRVSCKQLKSLEITLAGSLRREQMAETSIKQLEAEIEQLNRLVSQREEDTRCSKMMLKFREDKIRRMESLLGGLMSADAYLLTENNALKEEIELLRTKIDKNPEVTRFALENIRLLEQVRRFQDLYNEGERELLMNEISELRNQLIFFLDGNSKHPTSLDAKKASYHASTHGEVENGLLHKELTRTLSELEESKNKLNCCLEENAKLRREVEDLRDASLSALAPANQEQDCSTEVIKESIVEVPSFRNQSRLTAPRQREMEGMRGRDPTSGNPAKLTEDIMDLQLELDILKVILQEERSSSAEKEELAKSINRELRLSRETVSAVIKEHEKAQEELKNAMLVIEALESQQVQLINEVEDLKNSNIHYEDMIKEKKLEFPNTQEQTRLQEFRDIPRCNRLKNEESSLESRLKKMHDSLEKAKRLNKRYQDEHLSQLTHEEEVEEICNQVEAETAEAIICLQEELSILQQEVLDCKLNEKSTRDKLVEVEAQVRIMEESLLSKDEDNAKFAAMLEDKEKQLRTLIEAWDLIAGEIEDILSGGHESLKDISDQIDAVSGAMPNKQIWISEQFGRMKQYILEKESLIKELNRCLKEAVDNKNDMECMLRSLRGAALVMTEAHQQDCAERDKEISYLRSELDDKTSTIEELRCLLKCGQDQLKTSSSCATAAFVLLSRMCELSSANQDTVKGKQIISDKDISLQNWASVTAEADKQIHSLQMKLEASEEHCSKLRLELAEERGQHKALIKSLEENEENIILETLERLKELDSGLSTLKSCMSEHAKQYGNPQTLERTPCLSIPSYSSDVACEKECITDDICLASESIRKSVNERDASISLIIKKELEHALENLQQFQVAMSNLSSDKEGILASEKCSRKSIEPLINQATLLQDAIVSFEGEVQLKINAMDLKMSKLEEIAQESFTSWFEQRELLDDELDAAKVVAAQKTIEASYVFEKFMEVQDTMKEADIMINELMIANKVMKSNVSEIKARENDVISERDELAKEVKSLRLSADLKDQKYAELEKQYDADFVIMKRILSELEGAFSHLQMISMGEWKSMSSDFLSVKSQVFESLRLIKELFEDVWSEIIAKDCAVSILHLCHMGILLETASGLNAENGLLRHGLCESSSIISGLREHNFRSSKELEMCSVLKGKLLADIMKAFDRISCKVNEAGEVTLRLSSFEKKIQELHFLEEKMLQRSNDLGSELTLLMKELDHSNKCTIASILDQERVLEEKDELLQQQEENFIVELLAKDFELLVLSTQLKLMYAERTHNSTLEVLDSLKLDVVFKSLEASSMELIFLEMESMYENLLEEYQTKESELETSSRLVSELYEQIQVSQNDMNLQETKLHSLRTELEKKDEELGTVRCLEKEKGILQNELSDCTAECHRLRGNVSILENCITKLEEDLSLARAEIENLQLSHSVIKDGLCLRTQDLERELGNANTLKEENILLRNELKLCRMNEYEYQNALNLKIMKSIGLAENVDHTGCKIVDLIEKKIADVEDKFFFISSEMGKADEMLEQFKHVNYLAMQLDSDISSLRIELARKDDILKGLLFDLSLLQESASNNKDQKDEKKELLASLRSLEKDFELKSIDFNDAVSKCQLLEVQLQENEAKISALEMDCAEDRETINILSRKNAELLTVAEEASNARSSLEKELDETKSKIENLETEVFQMGNTLAQMNKTNESLKSDLDAVTCQRDELDAEVFALTKELEIARTHAEENETIALEAQEIAEFQKVRADEKEEEVKLLEHSIEELECTINVLEQKVDIVKEESERQQLQREELELELLGVREQMYKLKSNDSEMKRLLDEKERNLQESLERLQLLEKEIAAKDGEISQCKAHICELNLHAEAHASEYKQKFMALEAMVEQVKSEVPPTYSAHSSSNKLERKDLKPRGSGSPFKCIGLGLSQQIKSEKDEELAAGRQRIEELEALAANRQKEIFTLKARLAATESMTHDVIRDLLAVKLNMKSYANLIDNQQLHSLVERNQERNVEDEVKQQEIINLKQQINEFVKERNGWLEEIERKQAELMAAYVSLEKLRQQDKMLATENEMLKTENATHRRRVMELEVEAKKLSGQQNIQQRIHHHAKIKEENNSLRHQNEDLSIRLHKTESILACVKEELAQFRSANGRKPYIDFDEVQDLDKKLQETEVERLQLAQKLLDLCTNVLKAAGITRPVSEINPSVAEEVLEQLKSKVVSLELELHDVKLKNRISEERIRLAELRTQTPMNSRDDENCLAHEGASRASILSGFNR